jgi:hypothetical protein
MIALRPADENERIINVETDGPAVRLVDFVPHAWAFSEVGQVAPLIGFTLAPLWIHAQIEPLPRARNTPLGGAPVTAVLLDGPRKHNGTLDEILSYLKTALGKPLAGDDLLDPALYQQWSA